MFQKIAALLMTQRVEREDVPARPGHVFVTGTYVPPGEFSSHIRVSLSWTLGSSDETGVRVYRRLAPAGTWGVHAELGPGATSITPSTQYNLSGFQYEFRIAAFNSGGESIPGPVRSVRMPGAAPTLSIQQEGDGTGFDPLRLKLSWNLTSANNPWRIERRVGAGAWTTLTSPAAGVATYTDETVTPGQEYSYRIISVGVGFQNTVEGEWSNVQTTTPVQLNAPSNLQYTLLATDPTVGSMQYRLNWTNVSSGHDGTRVYRRTAGTVAGSFGAWTLLTTVGAAQEQIIVLWTSGEPAKFEFRVANYKGSQEGPFSNVVSQTRPLQTPTGLDYTVLGKEDPHPFRLTWTDPSMRYPQFRVQRSVDGGSYLDLTTVGPGPGQYEGNWGAVLPQSFGFQVRATQNGENSSYSTPLTRQFVRVGTPAGVTAYWNPDGAPYPWKVEWTDPSNASSIVIRCYVGDTQVHEVAVGTGVGEYSESEWPWGFGMGARVSVQGENQYGFGPEVIVNVTL